jgi:hypothetical protein
MRKDRVRRDREDLDRERETVSSVIEIVLHKQEDDLNFLFREFLLLSRVNNNESVSAVALANLGGNELLIISVRCNEKCSLSKQTSSYSRLFKLISGLLEDALTKSACRTRPR